MKWPAHMALGAAAAILPDAALALYGWRSDWLPENHALVRVHRALHHPAFIVAVAVATHIIADRYSKHRHAPVHRGT